MGSGLRNRCTTSSEACEIIGATNGHIYRTAFENVDWRFEAQTWVCIPYEMKPPQPLSQSLRKSDLKATALLKLIYLEMFGHDMSWASFHVLEVMSSSKFLQKRVGYLGAVQSFRPDTEVLMLATNLLKKVIAWIGTALLPYIDRCAGYQFGSSTYHVFAASHATSYHNLIPSPFFTIRFAAEAITLTPKCTKEDCCSTLSTCASIS